MSHSQTDHTQGTPALTYPFRSPRGDVLALIGQDGNITSAYAYEPYGEMEEGYAAEGTPYLLQDDYRDPQTDLYQMQARWYDPQAALFTSQDPALGDATDPILRYTYAYCGADPEYNPDPSGRRNIEGEDESGRMITHAPMSWLTRQGAKYGESGGSYTRRYKQQQQQRLNQIRAQAMAERGTETMIYIRKWDNVGDHEIIEDTFAFWSDSEDPFLRYIANDQRARRYARKFSRHLQAISDREFSTELAGVMAYIMLEAGPTNLRLDSILRIYNIESPFKLVQR